MVHSLRHLRENICQILERIYGEELARSNDGENDSRSASGFRASGEHPVFSADGERPDAIFDEIIADLDPAVFEEAGQFVPAVQAVEDCLADGTFRPDVPNLGIQP